ncbi:DUF971 domain-containing protein [Silvimonas sp.]|uniref:DUF971 domain-containing protein n=1 Tax=Silvimonas sp. TaxID=2650811 RepID=UPI00283CE2BB|nr:DUF971 domain-containing protein [Silvimonas sp.]MDR3428759.1 DUF971 domain-containing protein [Silvimonas sp.]
MNPVQLELTPKVLRVSWADLRAEFSFPQLRAECRCTECQAAWLQGEKPDIQPGLVVRDITLIGYYAIQLHFSDGHERGIFPWDYLYKLAINH